jgi:hypothetical protein
MILNKNRSNPRLKAMKTNRERKPQKKRKRETRKPETRNQKTGKPPKASPLSDGIVTVIKVVYLPIGVAIAPIARDTFYFTFLLHWGFQ